MNQKYNVIGMSCPACSAAVERSVKKLEGAEDVNVNLLSNSMTVHFDESILDDNSITSAVESAGYGASVFTHGAAPAVQKTVDPVQEELKSMRVRLIVSFAFWIPLMYLAMHHMLKEWIGLSVPDVIKNTFRGVENGIPFAFTQLLPLMPIVYVNRKYFQVDFKTLWKHSPNMGSLIATGSTAAIACGIFAIYKIGYALGVGDTMMADHYLMDLYFELAGTILTLITLGKYLEARPKGKISEAISKLMDLAPKTAEVLRDGEEVEIPVEQVRMGDIMLIRPGKNIPVDGVIAEGSSVVDQSVPTGGSIPVEKTMGDSVIAATLNKTGFFKMEAKKVGGGITLAQIIKLVEEASSSKAPIAKPADKVSGVFVPIIIVIALLATVVWLVLGRSFEFALSIAITVLVIPCPHAPGLATPVAIMAGTGKGASNSILIKSAEALETAHTVGTVVLDKTGTITEGEPRVTDTLPAPGIQEQELLTVAVSIEKPLGHPLAEVIVEKAVELTLELSLVGDFQAVSSRGILTSIGGEPYTAGNLALMQEQKVDTGALQQQAEAFSEQGKTSPFFAKGGRLLGMIVVADVIKPTSRQAVREFIAMGINVIMLTGDNKHTAEAIRRQMGIDRVVVEALPQDKEEEVRLIQESDKRVVMIGDDINDAPALARADVGIAIGAGIDIVIESADIALMESGLMDVVTTIQLSHTAIRSIRENLFWAFFYNNIGIPLTAGVFYVLLGWKLNPMFTAAAMSLSSVCVVTNALRLKFFKPRRQFDGETEI